jgi:hypothetical protein
MAGDDVVDLESRPPEVLALQDDLAVMDLGHGRIRQHLDRVPVRPRLQHLRVTLREALAQELGMDVRASFAAMYGDPIRELLPGYIVRVATADDEAVCNALCMHVLGHTRAGEVEEAIDDRLARVVERLGRMTGYTTGVSYFAHSVAETSDDLRALIGAADDYGTPCFLVPLADGELLRWCRPTPRGQPFAPQSDQRPE